jgi:hypothetical protein
MLQEVSPNLWYLSTQLQSFPYQKTLICGPAVSYVISFTGILYRRVLPLLRLMDFYLVHTDMMKSINKVNYVPDSKG